MCQLTGVSGRGGTSYTSGCHHLACSVCSCEQTAEVQMLQLISTYPDLSDMLKTERLQVNPRILTQCCILQQHAQDLKSTLF